MIGYLIPGVIRQPAASAPSRAISLLRAGAVNTSWFAGTGRIVGTVKEKSSPSNVPLARRVVLHEMASCRVLAETTSSAADGSYTFTGLSLTCKYYAVAFDHLGNYRGVVADNLVPERTP